MSLQGLPVFIEVFWKSGVALGAALCVTRLLRKRSAAWRRLVLSSAIVAMFAAALALPVLPRWIAALPGWPQFRIPALPPVFNTNAKPATAHGPIAQDPIAHDTGQFLAPVTEIVRPEAASGKLPGGVPVIWVLGTALFLIRFAIGLRGLRRLRIASRPVIDAELLAELNIALARLGCVRARPGRIALMQNDSIAAPITWGLLWGMFRPVILVPPGFGQLRPESRHAILCHELAHIQEHDFFFRVLAEIARSLLWFQPLMWIASRQLREEQELACDDCVLAAGGKPSVYAKLLLDWELQPGAESLFAAGMAQRSSLKRRICALLDRDVQRSRVGAPRALATWFLGLATALPLAAIGFTSAIPPAPPAPMTRVPAAPSWQTPAMLPPPKPRMRLAQALPASTPLPAQTPSPTPLPRAASANVRTVPAPLPLILSNTSLAMVDVIVTDPAGKVVEGLDANDFIVKEDGNPQAIKVFEFQKVDDPSRNISSYYVLGYYAGPKGDGLYRRIAIALKGNPTAKLQYREGRYADKTLNSDTVNNIGAHFTVADGSTGAINEEVVQLNKRIDSLELTLEQLRRTYRETYPEIRNLVNQLELLKKRRDDAMFTQENQKAPNTYIGSATRPPAVMFEQDPEYSEQARKAKYSGTVALLVEVGASGQVTGVTVIHSAGMGLDEKAVEAIAQWKFRPGSKDGNPVATQLQVNMNFRLL
jgi:TonB family protein